MKLNSLKILGTAAMLSFLAGCGSVHGLSSLSAPPGLYNKTLFREYKNLAVNEGKDSALFSDKARKVSAGGKVAPINPKTLKLSHANKGRAVTAFNRLNKQVTVDTIDTFPAQSAHAQAMYDCWVTELQKGRKATGCGTKWRNAIAEIEKLRKSGSAALLPTIETYEVYFDWNSTTLRDDAVSTLDQVAVDMKIYKPTDITVTGHADRSGNDAFNQKISTWRAVAVSKALNKRGVSSRVIDEKGRGEMDPAVPSRDGDRLEANRRVVIDFRK